MMLQPFMKPFRVFSDRWQGKLKRSASVKGLYSWVCSTKMGMMEKKMETTGVIGYRGYTGTTGYILGVMNRSLFEDVSLAEFNALLTKAEAWP